MKWYGGRDVPLEVNESHHWSLRDAPDSVAVAASFLAAYNAKHPGSSSRIGRVLLLKAPPDTDANEITDKGYINQRAVLEHRNHLAEKLFEGGDGGESDPDIIVLD